jgi:hypothetical protein
MQIHPRVGIQQLERAHTATHRVKIQPPADRNGGKP